MESNIKSQAQSEDISLEQEYSEETSKESNMFSDWDEELKGKTFTFENIGGRKSDVLVLHSRIFANGAVSFVHECIISVGGHKRRFIIKTFKSSLPPNRFHSLATANFNNYKLIKQVSSKVFPTFRKSLNNDAILMTMGNSGDYVCLGTVTSPKTESLNAFGYNKIDRVVNFENFLKELLTEMNKLTIKGIGVPGDVTFLLLSDFSNGEARADFVFGDLDTLNTVEKINFSFNVNIASFIVWKLLDEIMDSNDKSSYINLANEYFAKEGFVFPNSNPLG
ncbi:MAG: hypothetical protein HZA95_00335 [Candidatus Vogelbacteria bacterium]|nr:hypothetical protein [Candidatus Vogelbacteria bacterium]